MPSMIWQIDHTPDSGTEHILFGIYLGSKLTWRIWFKIRFDQNIQANT